MRAFDAEQFITATRAFRRALCFTRKDRMEILLLFAESGSASLGPIIGLLAVLIIIGLLAVLITIGILSKTALAGGSGGSRHKPKAYSPIGNYTYYRHDIMSAAERAFFEKLYAAVRDQYWVFTKVSLWEIARNREQGGWNKIAQKHADFVLCDPRQKGKVVLVVELDDRSHNSASVQKRDAQKEAVLASAGVPLLRIKGVGNPDAAAREVLKKLEETRR